MNKVFLVIQREYLTRVRKKSFLIMTILGPLLMGGLFVGSIMINKVDTELKTIAVVDETNIFKDKFKDSDRLQFVFTSENIDSVKRESVEKGYFGVLYIRATTNLSSVEKAVTIYSESQPSFDVISKIKFTIEKEINANKYVAAGIDEKKLNAIKTDVEIRTRDLENKVTSTPLTTVLGIGGGILIYLFIFIYGAMVMRGVLEEKTSRIVEVIISSIKPFQLMMGKIVGVALVGLTQFLLWVVLTIVIYSGVASYAMNGKSDKEKMEMMMKTRPGMNNAMMNQAMIDDSSQDNGAQLSQIM